MATVVTVTLIGKCGCNYNAEQLLGIFDNEKTAEEWIRLYGDDAKDAYMFAENYKFNIESWNICMLGD